MKISLNFFYCALAFICIALALRFLLPFGSEPDFEHRVSVILNSDSYLLSIHNYLFSGYNWKPNCSVNYTMSGFTGSISNFLCGEELSLKLTRWFLQIIFFFSFFAVFLMSLAIQSASNDIKRDQDYRFAALIVSLIFPSAVYYSGVAAEETIVLWLSLLAMCFLRKPYFLIIITFMVFLIEVGGGIILSLFLLTLYSLNIIWLRFGYRVTEVVAFLLVVTSLVLKMQLLQLLTGLPIIGSKVNAIFYAYTFTSYAEIVDKYPTLFRPIITFMTGVFMTSDGVKALFLYPICAFVTLKLFVKQRNYCFKEGNDIYLGLLAVITFILCTVFVLPGYTNAKYYIFTLPIFMYAAIAFYGFRKVFLFNTLCSFTVVFQLLLSRL